jgi:hypothetical protein
MGDYASPRTKYDLRADSYCTMYKINGTFTSIDTLHKSKKRVKY